MAEITTDILITNILNGMQKTLDDEQLKQLKDILHIQLHDIEVSNKCYDLVSILDENDTKKIQFFVASERVRNLSDGTILQYIGSVRKMRTFIGKNFADITTEDIQFYLSSCSLDRHWKTTTIVNNINYLNAFFTFLKKKKIITENPIEFLDSTKTENVIRMGFNPSEIERIKLACNNDFRDIAMIEFFLATGVRVSELVNLKWADLDFTHLEVFIKCGKGKKDRIVPFTEKCGFYLLRYLDYRMTNENRSKEEMLLRPLFVRRRKDSKTKDYESMTNGGVEKILKKLGTKAFITDIYPHKFRRTMASDAINHGMPIEALMQIMGHERYDTTLGYAHLKPSRVSQLYHTHFE